MRVVGLTGAFIGTLLCAALVGCVPSAPVGPSAVAPPNAAEPVPSAANGIVFVREGSAYVVRDGVAVEVADDGISKLGIGYSADGRELLVTEDQGPHRVVRMMGISAGEPGIVVLNTAQGSTLGAVRATGRPGDLYAAALGDPGNALLRRDAELASQAASVSLASSFSGEFDVDTTGTIVYTSSGQNPSTLTLRSGAVERPLVAGLATVFTPSFSSDGARICFTASEQAGGPISIWVVDRSAGAPRPVTGTGTLKPTSPVFSPGGDSIAFRSGTDGAMWMVPVAGGDPQRLAVTCDEAAIDW